MSPEQLAVVIDALGVGLWAHHMLHGSRAVLAVTCSPRRSRCSSTASSREPRTDQNLEEPTLMTTTDIARPHFARMYIRSAAGRRAARRDRAPPPPARRAAGHRRRTRRRARAQLPALPAGGDRSRRDRTRADPARRSRPGGRERAAVPIRVLPGVADELPLADESIDAAVASLVLCSVPDQERALAEITRVCVPSANCASTSTSSLAANPSGGCSRSPTTAASGPGSPAGVTPPATPARRSSARLPASRRATG